VQVAESINIEDICEAGSKAKILEETGEHVPGITLKTASFMHPARGFQKILT